MRISKPCLSVFSVPREKNHLGFVTISPTLVSNWYINGKVFTIIAAWKPINLIFFFKMARNWIWLSVPREKKSPCLRQYQSYISNWYVNGKVFTSKYYFMDSYPKIWFFFSKKFEIEFWLVPKSWIHLNFLNISPTLFIDRYINVKVFTSTTAWKPKNLNFFFSNKVRNWILFVPRERKSPWLRQYQSYISNWYINGKVFMSTSYKPTTWKPKNLNLFFKKVWKLILTCAEEL